VRIVGRAAIAACIVALVASACVAAPGTSPDASATAAAPSATTSPDASADASAVPSALASGAPASTPPCPTPLPLDPATGAMVTSVEALAALGDAASACYGDAKLELTAYVPAHTYVDDISGYAWDPAWLAGTLQFAILASAREETKTAWLAAYLSPSLGSCVGTQVAAACVLHPYVGRWLTVTGHFNDPASSTCTGTPRPGMDPTPPPITPAEAEVTCRTHFVLDTFAQAKATGDVPVVFAAMCPVEPITIEQMVAVGATIGPWYGLSCLKTREMTYRAYVVPGVGLLSGMEQYPMSPRWLADPLNTGIVLTETEADASNPANWLIARVPPDLVAGGESQACDGSAVDPASCPFAPYVGKYVRITGHYDDYESMSCMVSGGPGGSAAPGTTPITPDAVILGCREQFVIDSVAAASGPAPSPTPPTTSTESRP
jgi:hypothetical protein